MNSSKMNSSSTSSKSPFRGRDNIKRKIADTDEPGPEKKQKKETRSRQKKENIQIQPSQGYCTRSSSRAEPRDGLTTRASLTRQKANIRTSRGSMARARGSRDATGLFKLQSNKRINRSVSVKNDSALSQSMKGPEIKDDSIRRRTRSSATQRLERRDFAKTKSPERVVRRTSIAKTKRRVAARVSRTSSKLAASTESLADKSKSEDLEEDTTSHPPLQEIDTSHRVVECGIRSDGTVCRCVSSILRNALEPTPCLPSTSSSASGSESVPEDSDVEDVEDDSSDITLSSGDWSDVSSLPDLVLENSDLDSGDSSDRDTFFNDSSDIDEDLERNSAPSSRLHRCTAACPFGCRGNRRPSEVVIFEGTSSQRLLSSDVRVSVENPVLANLDLNMFKRVGGKRARKAGRQTTVMNNKTTMNPRVCLDKQLCNIPQRVAVVFHKQKVSRGEALKHAWNPQDRSFNIRLKENDPFTIHRQPVAQSTDSARTLLGYSSGLHIFEVDWPLEQRGTHASVGVATNMQILHSIGYSSLIGLSDESWGWDLGRLKAHHMSSIHPGVNYPSFNHEEFSPKQRFFMVLDCEEGTLGFISSGRWLGISHSDLEGKLLYPSVSCVWGHCEIMLRYHGGSEERVPKLSELCRVEIGRRCKQFTKLPIPGRLKKFLDYDDSQ